MPLKDQARLSALSRFQTTILSHALRFRNARRVVYSTCSFHEEENEAVINAVLRKTEFDRWRLAPRADVMPTWERRGNGESGM